MALRQKGPTLVGVLWMETILCIFILGLRLYTRTMIRRNLGWDDLLLVITVILMIVFAGLCTGSAFHGMGVHADLLNTEETVHGMLLLLIGQSVIAIAMGLSKCAVAAFLMRIVVKKWHKAFLWFWIVSIMFLSVFLAISVFAQCTPARSIWDSRVKRKGCSLNLTIIATVMCAWSAVLDFVLALFPWLALWNLNMKKKEKTTICLSLSLGIFAGICGIIRTTGLDALSQSSDYLYATTDSVMWTNSELTTTIICVSVPALRPLYRSLRGGLSSSDPSSYNNMTPYYAKNSGARSYGPEYALETMTTTTVHGKGGHEGPFEGEKHIEVDQASEDTDTQRILSSSNYNTHTIHQVTEVEVSYEDRRAGSERDNMPAMPVKAKTHV